MSCAVLARAKAVPVPMSASLLLALLLMAAASWSRQATLPAEDHFAATQRAHYSALCHAHKDLDSCSDAVRWSPGDPALVVALADALLRAGRTAEAVRDYRRAADLAPGMHGLDVKIKSAERRAPKKPAGDRVTANSDKRFSNADPEAQSH